MPGQGHHTAKWDSCVEQVEEKGTADNPYAVCTAALGPSKLADAAPKATPIGKPFKKPPTK